MGGVLCGFPEGLVGGFGFALVVGVDLILGWWVGFR